MKKLARQITGWCHDNEYMDEDDREIVAYGMELILENVVKTAIMLLIAVGCGRFKETALILLVFSCLRYWAGGVHMKTSLGCFAGMLGMWGLSLAAGEYLELDLPLYVIMSVVILISYMVLAPKGNKKNPLTDADTRKKMKIWTMFFVVLFLVIGFICPYAEIRAYIIMPAWIEALTLLPKES